jgi:hypothetical protein
MQVQRLCARACLLDNGVVVSRPTDGCGKAYWVNNLCAPRHSLNLGSLLTIDELYVEQGCLANAWIPETSRAIAYNLREPTETAVGVDLSTSEGLHLFRTYDMQPSDSGNERRIV